MHFANIDILYAVFFKKLKDSNKDIDVNISVCYVHQFSLNSSDEPPRSTDVTADP